MPNSIGHQDLAALLARQPQVTERWRAHVRTSTFGTIHAASLSFPRITGTAIPDPFFTQLAALDPRALEATGSIPLNVPMDPVIAQPTYDFPVVDRRLKGDKLNVTVPASQAPARPRPDTPAKTKDQASLPPDAAPMPREQPAQPSQAALPKGDRVVPVQIREPVPGKIYRRAGIAAGQDTLAKRVLGLGRREPVVIAAPAAPAAPVADTFTRRIGGIASGQDTRAKRLLGLGPRRQAAVAAAPAKPAPVAAVDADASAAVIAAKPSRRNGLAAAHLNQIRTDAKRALIAAVPLSTETADLESQRADLAGLIVPPAPRIPLAETADLESQRADLLGQILPTPLVAVVPAEIAPQVPSQVAPQVAEVAPEPASEPEPQVAEIAAEPEPQVAEVPAPQPVPATPDQAAPAPAIAEVVPAAPAKTPDRFNAEAADQLAQFAKPAAQTRLYFGTRELGVGRNSWEAWEPEEVPTVLAPPHVDTEIKRAALDPIPNVETDKGGETIAPKGEVTGEGKRPRTPAERLNLAGPTRAKHAKCLANAIYFESRGEVERGQMAVAQVILNRAFSGYYPGNVCDVVYQNAHRHLACQFTFACDSHKDVVRDPPRWEIATRIADEALDGKFWLPEIGKATHYHATYVNPWWVRTMTKHSRIGVHIFYRPTRWGTLDEIPVWGDRLDVTGSIKREASPGSPATPVKGSDDKRAEAPAPVRRSIFDPVAPINLPGG